MINYRVEHGRASYASRKDTFQKEKKLYVDDFLLSRTFMFHYHFKFKNWSIYSAHATINENTPTIRRDINEFKQNSLKWLTYLLRISRGDDE